MKMRRLLMTKPQTYGTRRLEAGDECELPVMDAIRLVLKKQARFAPRQREAPATPEPAIAAAAPTAIETAEHKTIDQLRLEATQLGIDVDGRWGLARLQHEISQARRGR